jgi:hypothetical protein
MKKSQIEYLLNTQDFNSNQVTTLEQSIKLRNFINSFADKKYIFIDTVTFEEVSYDKMIEESLNCHIILVDIDFDTKYGILAWSFEKLFHLLRFIGGYKMFYTPGEWLPENDIKSTCCIIRPYTKPSEIYCGTGINELEAIVNAICKLKEK